MKPGFDAIPTAEGWQLSNAPVLSMAAHKAAIDIFDEAGMGALTIKSKKLTSYLLFLLDDMNKASEKNITQVITPTGENEYGCQVSILMLKDGKAVFNALTSQGIIADWREPDVIRVAPVPLYNSFEDVWKFGNVTRSILKV